MNTQTFELHWLEVDEAIPITELAGMCAMSMDDVNELVEYGALLPLQTTNAPERTFSALCVMPLRTACKLRQDFDLDLFTVGLVLGYLQRIDTLERKVRQFEAKGTAANRRDGLLSLD